MSIDERIKIWRAYLGWSQTVFCKQTGIPLRTQKGYEAGTRHPGSEALAAMASTGLNLNWLLTGEGEMAAAANEQDTKQVQSVPEGLSEFQENMQNIFDLLLLIDEDQRGVAIREMLNRVKDAARLSELERRVKNLQKD